MNAQRRTTTQQICNALREWHMPDHDELCTVIAGLAAKIKDSGFLGSEAAKYAVDFLDEAMGQIEEDGIKQLDEGMNHD